jgi:putative transposase
VRKKKWKRYERKHSLTAVHLDWVYNDDLEVYALPVIDDASRKLLALIESESATTGASIDAMEEAIQHGEIQQCITDHGTQFWKGDDAQARFPEFLKQKGIKHIPTKIKHPQNNGKSEKFGHLHKVHRKAFKTKEDFTQWYNEVRPHMSLKDEIFETPKWHTKERKKKGECI